MRPRLDHVTSSWLLVCSLGACGDESGSADAPSDGATDAAETAAPDTPDTNAPDSVAPDTTAPDTTTDTRPEASDLKQFQEPCSGNGECGSGWCVPSADGNVCTHDCTEGCPQTWGCGRVIGLGIDSVELCVDRSATLCHPCAEDDDCNVFTGGAANRCLDFELPDGSLAGRFCGIACDDAVACPEAYTCVDADGPGTPGDAQCRPADGACTCNPLAVALELATICSAKNDAGTCAGSRACAGDGTVTACDARAAVVESCNARDDDCDGSTDEDVLAGAACDITNAFGTCEGRGYCIAGEPACLGIAAVEESCDGNDQNCDGSIDEGFPDFDDDLEADCQDLDDDGDGTLDGDDCDPLDPARSNAATEVCGNDLDDDCDGSKEEEGSSGCETFRQDIDGDTFGSDVAPGRCLCAADAATFYVVQNTDDCDDIDAAVKPGGVEVCNGRDDSCEGNTDEGVQAPCGGCVNICLLEAGPDGASAFDLANATDLALDGQGNLRLAAGQTTGTYRHRWSGWPSDGTDWDVMFLDATFPSAATSVSVRWRTASTPGGLAAATFTEFSGPFPPESFPLYVETLGNHVEIELRLDTTDVAETPMIHGISILASAN